VKSGEADAAAERQRAVEIEWLVKAARPEWLARSDGAGFDPVPALVLPELERRIKEILCRPELVPLLELIERHNSQPREVPGRRLRQKDNFLLGPHLFQVLASAESRNGLRQRLPVLGQPAAEVRDHLRKVAADCQTLAALISKGPQPHLALAGETSANEALKVFAPWTELFEASDGSKRQVVAFTALIERAGGWFEKLADHVPRAKKNRHTGAGARRVRAAEFLVGVFRRKFGRPYHAHVATLAMVISGIPTDADFVKKIEARQN
jgi:hypothetical protein